MMKNLLFNRFTKSIEVIYRRIMVYVSFVIMSIYGIGIVYILISDCYNMQHFKELVGSAAGVATLAGLSFYAGYMTPYDHKKPVFYHNGERLYHAAILFSACAVIFSCISIVNKIALPEIFLSVLTSILVLMVVIFFVYGLIITNIAVIMLLLALHNDYKKLLDSHLNS